MAKNVWIEKTSRQVKGRNTFYVIAYIVHLNVRLLLVATFAWESCLLFLLTKT